MKNLRGKSLVLILIFVIIFLSGVIAYVFLIKPAINGFVVAEQNKGIDYGKVVTIAYLMQQAALCDPEGVPVYFGNVTLHMIAKECLQQTPELKISG
jgi:hypothetical protein